jgi:hypothetical protein
MEVCKIPLGTLADAAPKLGRSVARASNSDCYQKWLPKGCALIARPDVYGAAPLAPLSHVVDGKPVY